MVASPATPVQGLRLLTPVPAEHCPAGRPASRRFYVHERSLAELMLARPAFQSDLTYALLLSAASRGADFVIEDLELFSVRQAADVSTELRTAVRALHDEAAEALQLAFRCVLQLVPPRFGSTEVLLGQHEKINAWCFEGGYFTYATDEDAALVMYAETGSLRELRSNIRRDPEYDTRLQIISGSSLFLFDQSIGAGVGSARLYRQQHNRLLRRYANLFDTQRLTDRLTVQPLERVTALLGRFDDPAGGRALVSTCRQRVQQTLSVLLSEPAGELGLRAERFSTSV